MEIITDPSQRQPMPKTYLVESILVTIFCCLPFGIAGIVNAAKVESRYNTGDVEGAYRASTDAAKWTKIGLIVGIVAGVFYTIAMYFGFYKSMM